MSSAPNNTKQRWPVYMWIYKTCTHQNENRSCIRRYFISYIWLIYQNYIHGII